jgi:hypothetical protein
MYYVGAVLLGFLWLLVRRRYGAAPWPRVPQLDRAWIVPGCALALLGLFVAQLWTVAFEAHHQIIPPCVLHQPYPGYLHLPIPVVADLDQTSGGPAMILPGVALAVYAVVQSILLTCLFLAAEQSRPSAWERRLVGAAFACAIVAAILSPAMTSTDPYLYLSYSKVGFASFAPAPHTLEIPDLPKGTWCYGLLLPSPYGPGFVSYMQGIFGAIHNASVAIVLLRTTNAVWLLACIAFMRRLGVSWPILAVFALNPAVLFQYVTNAHNDIIALCLVLAAMAFDLAAPLAGSVVVALAGLIKLPFAVIGALAFAERVAVRNRITAALLSAAGAFIVSYMWAGPQYFKGLAFYNDLRSMVAPGAEIVLAVVALASVVVALVRRTYSGAASFSFPGLPLAQVPPWYAPWGLPYALRERAHTAWFLVLLPVAALLMDESVSARVRLVLYLAICFVTVVFVLRDLAYRARQRHA